ncbi:MAG: hypothetical protein MK110_11095 [Fuerstiella sp.]|nr:hypothetical protein [Fuerstiella sp.]
MNLPNSTQIRVAFWNLQNLFDIEPSPIASELGVSAISGWDRRALEARLETIATSIRGMFGGDGPELIGLAELENERVGQLLLTAIGRDDYVLLTAGGSQFPATGTALICSKRIFETDSAYVRGHLVHLRFPTADILEVRLKLVEADTELTVLVNHWPSRREPNSSAFRQTIASYAANLVDRYLRMNRREYLALADTERSRYLLQERWNRNLLLMGSFNDDPWDRSLSEILNAGYRLQATQQSEPIANKALLSWRAYAARRPQLFNPTWSLLGLPDQGTCVNPIEPGRLSVFDQMVLSRGLIAGKSGLKVMENERRVPHLECLSSNAMTDDCGYPISFNSETCEGFSDRLPLGLTLEMTTLSSFDTAVLSTRQGVNLSGESA